MTGLVSDAAPCPIALPETKLPPLQAKGLALECAAGRLNSVAAWLDAGQSSIDDFADAQADYEHARHAFRDELASASGQSATWLERLLSL